MTTINGRTPEEIKAWLMPCKDRSNCGNCCSEYLCSREAIILAYIQQLERERDEARNDLDTINYANTELHSAYEAMKRERDAAMENLPHLCILCKFQPADFKEKPHAKCTTCIRQRNWEWIGPQEVN